MSKQYYLVLAVRVSNSKDADLFLLRVALYKLMSKRQKENSDAGSSQPDAKKSPFIPQRQTGCVMSVVTLLHCSPKKGSP